MQGPFVDFIKRHILLKEGIAELEIISPYFQQDHEIISVKKEFNLNIKIELPFKKGFCLIEQNTYEYFKTHGFKWHYPIDLERKSHSKVYRFYGEKRVYTIIGSVNLTKPAWNGIDTNENTVSNIESAILFIEKYDTKVSLLGKEVKNEMLRYNPSATDAEEWQERVEIPEINFTIDWINKTLSWTSNTKKTCYLHLSKSQIYNITKKETIHLSGLPNCTELLKIIAKQSLLEVKELINDKEHSHWYYLHQIGFENRPLEFKFSASDIIDAWEILGNRNVDLNEWLIHRLELAADLLQDESGILSEATTINKSLLNQMARHFYGLVKLEEFLFSEDILNKNKDVRAIHFGHLKYYLSSDNVDTLKSYISDLKDMYSKGDILGVYYWLILNIILTNFYRNKIVWKR
jgi:hypothetical protein